MRLGRGFVVWWGDGFLGDGVRDVDLAMRRGLVVFGHEVVGEGGV